VEPHVRLVNAKSSEKVKRQPVHWLLAQHSLLLAFGIFAVNLGHSHLRINGSPYFCTRLASGKYFSGQ
jgi:hypothetical protein